MSRIARCLFCKKPSETSKSVEHIIPESIGSKKKILPKGIICDNCNNYFSIKIENPLLSHKSFRNIRALHQVPNKKGKMPSLLGILAGSEVEVALKLKNNILDIKPEKGKDKQEFDRLFQNKLYDGTFKPLIFTIEMDPPKKLMSRFLAKMALEAMVYRYIEKHDWIDRIIDETHFDLIRNFARFGTNDKFWPFYQRRIFPVETQMIHPKTGKWVQAGFGHDLFITSKRETFFIFVLYGVEFVINIGGPSIKGYMEWLEENHNISPLIERLGIKLVKKVVNQRNEYFLEGNFDINKGITFDKERMTNSKKNPSFNGFFKSTIP